MITRTMYLYTETPLHAGAGSGLSSIDLPIQRERATQYPIIQGSGIKGKLRATLEGNREELTAEARDTIDVVFGPPTTNGAGATMQVPSSRETLACCSFQFAHLMASSPTQPLSTC